MPRNLKSYNIRELQRLEHKLGIKGIDPRYIIKVLRKALRLAKLRERKDDIGQIRLILGDAYLWMRLPILAGKQFRYVLKMNPSNIDAFIGIHNSYHRYHQPGKANLWLERALQTAKQANDLGGQVKVLDHMAFDASCKNNKARVADLYAEMCSIIEDAPKLEDFPLLTVFTYWGASNYYDKPLDECSLDLLSSCLRHILKYLYTGAYYSCVIHSLVKHYKLMGMSKEQIWDKFQSFLPLIKDERVDWQFRSAIRRAFDRLDRQNNTEEQ